MTRPTKIAIRRQHTGDRVFDEMQRLAQQTAQKVNSLSTTATAAGPFGKGVAVTNQSISTAGTTVTHNLGRVPTGYLITRYRSNTNVGATILENGAMTTTTAPFLCIQGNGAAPGASTVTVDLWFY